MQLVIYKRALSVTLSHFGMLRHFNKMSAFLLRVPFSDETLRLSYFMPRAGTHTVSHSFTDKMSSVHVRVNMHVHSQGLFFHCFASTLNASRLWHLGYSKVKDCGEERLKDVEETVKQSV